MPPMHPQKRKAFLLEELKVKEKALQDLPADENASSGSSPVRVVVGTSALANEHRGLEERLTDMIHKSYGAVGGTGPRMLEMQPVSVRLQMGDSGVRNNRVLHVAFRAGEVVGCISSSFRTTWTEPGVGHWGLLVVDLAAQGTGVASALVQAAERRIAEECHAIHIEYDFIAGEDHSTRLRAWYEKIGYKQLGARPKPGPKGSEFAFCRKRFTKEQKQLGKTMRLRAEKHEIRSELLEVENAIANPGILGSEYAMKSQSIFNGLAAITKVKGEEGVKWLGAIFQFIISDAGPEGRFVLDLKNVSGSTRVGEDPKADCIVRGIDDDIFAWAEHRLDGIDAFWSGRLKIDRDRGGNIDRSTGDQLIHGLVKTMDGARAMGFW